MLSPSLVSPATSGLKTCLVNQPGSWKRWRLIAHRPIVAAVGCGHARPRRHRGQRLRAQQGLLRGGPGAARGRAADGVPSRRRRLRQRDRARSQALLLDPLAAAAPSSAAPTSPSAPATATTVDAFHAAALAAGGSDNGAPGPRPIYHPGYYGAFVLDPDGNNVEAVCHRSAEPWPCDVADRSAQRPVLAAVEDQRVALAASPGRGPRR